MPQQLDKYSRTVFGFSFRKDWEPGKTEKWNRLNSFFDERHAVAHRTGAPSTEKLWEGLPLTREVLDKIRALLPLLSHRALHQDLHRPDPALAPLELSEQTRPFRSRFVAVPR